MICFVYSLNNSKLWSKTLLKTLWKQYMKQGKGDITHLLQVLLIGISKKEIKVL